MRDLKAHFALFVVAVVATLLTWNRGPAGRSAADVAPAWEYDSTDFRWFRYGNPALDLRIERREDAGGPFYWGVQIHKDRSPEPLQFPVGASGAALIPRLVVLRVLRHLGALSPEQRTRFGLADSDERITVDFTDEQRELVVGDSVFGSGDRYILEPATGTGYVISRHVMTQLELGEGALRERLLHNFPPRNVAEVRVTAGAGRERTMTRTESDEWADPGSGTPDTGFGNFMERVDDLAIEGFDSLPPVEGLRLVLRLEYLDDDGDTLGFTEVLRQDLPEGNVYYLRSESTRIIARAHKVLTERVEQAVEEIF